MLLFVLLTLLFVKNIIYYLVLKACRIRLILLIAGFLIMVLSLFLAAKMLNFNDSGILPMIINIDFFLILFGFYLKQVSRLITYIKHVYLKGKVDNPLEVFAGIEINLLYFYIVVTAIQTVLLYMCLRS